MSFPMKMTFQIQPVKRYTPPTPNIQMQPVNLANINADANADASIYTNPIVIGSIFQKMYSPGPCGSCGK
jgi:hypothetical protein